MVISQLPLELLEQLGVERGPAQGRRHRQANTALQPAREAELMSGFPCKRGSSGFELKGLIKQD